MDDDLKRFRADEELFGKSPTPRQPEPTEATEAMRIKANAVIDLLRAAMLKPPFGADVDNAVELWAIKLAPFPIQLLVQVVQEWVDEPGNEFPSIGDIVTIATQRRRREAAIDRGMEHRQPGQVCPRCHDTGWEDGPVFKLGEAPEEGPDGRTPYTSVRPCITCRPDRHRAWANGCDAPEHVTRGGCAECNPNRRHHKERAA